MHGVKAGAGSIPSEAGAAARSRSGARSALPSIRRLSFLPVLVLASAICCSDHGPRRYGALSAETPLTPIADLLTSPELHLGRSVAVRGTVAQVCQEMGCWFEVTDSGRRLLVDLEMGRHFTVPKDAAGMAARVEGLFVRQDGVLKILGRGVELTRS